MDTFISSYHFNGMANTLITALNNAVSDCMYSGQVNADEIEIETATAQNGNLRVMARANILSDKSLTYTVTIER